MQATETTFTTLLQLADRLGLPAAWLKAEAIAGRIPCLKAGRSLRFNPLVVQRVLEERATATNNMELQPA